MTNARATYMDASVATASPARLLVMLLDRLVLDVQRGLEAQHNRDLEQVHRQLTHAQDIVVELQSSLRPDEFDGGARLAALYAYLYRRLVEANVRKDVAATDECLGLVTALADTWREAALESAGSLASLSKGA
ncbi:MAG TPA: flagellar export chaperone FliS [Marmoricola sp.]|nr:flagellar export chaperone FliS [Marmoricola sp.]